MTSSYKSTLIFATATAIALTSFDLRPAAAAPEGGPAIIKQNTSDEFSSQRRRRGRGVHPAVPLAAFGAIVGTIGAVAAAQQRRDYYDRQYYGGPQYYYGGPQYGPYAHQPAPYAHHPAPVYRHHGGHHRWQGHAAPQPRTPEIPLNNSPGHL